MKIARCEREGRRRIVLSFTPYLHMEKEFNRHHLIPASKWWLTNKYNINLVDTKEHSRRHTRCWNDTPVEAICRVLLWNEKIRTDNFRADLMAVLDNYINNYYTKKSHQGTIKSEIESVLSLEK